ncbi:MAG: DUF3524 domain-containing protein [bacterium]
MANVLLVEPFYGGSHRAFADGLVRNSDHSFQVLCLPDRFWKWRMRGGALTLADRARALDFRPDVVLASDMLSLAEFKSLSGLDVPAVVYMHENQLCYPVLKASRRDVHVGFTNITTCLAADKVLWNSCYHMESFFDALPGFLSMMPDHHPSRVSERIREKSEVLYPGVDLASIDQARVEKDTDPPLIVWNHRWEFDKRPEDFFAAIYELERDGLDFGLVILGENFQVKPRPFLEAQERLGHRIVCLEYVPDRGEYLSWLCRSSVSVSTASQENFGIAAVEAAYAGARPLWPDRLSYPELLGSGFREHLYHDFSDLVLKLKKALRQGPAGRGLPERQAQLLFRFDWSQLISLYDGLLEQTASGG